MNRLGLHIIFIPDGVHVFPFLQGTGDEHVRVLHWTGPFELPFIHEEEVAFVAVLLALILASEYQNFVVLDLDSLADLHGGPISVVSDVFPLVLRHIIGLYLSYYFVVVPGPSSKQQDHLLLMHRHRAGCKSLDIHFCNAFPLVTLN